MHEHVFTVESEMAENYPQLAWNGSREVRVGEAIETLGRLKSKGIDTVVDMNVLGLGRSMDDVLAVAAQVDMNIILATGVYPRNGLPGALNGRSPSRGPDGRLSDVLAEIFITDIEEGIAGSRVKAGLIKGYTDVAGVTPLIDRTLRAVAAAHRVTGAPISTHTNARARVGLEQQRVFREEGVDLTRVVIGHSGDTTDLDYLREIMDAGSTIGSDRFGLYLGDAPKLADRVQTIAALCGEGYADRIVLSHDAHCHADYDFEDGPINRTTLPDWHLLHIADSVLPALRDEGVAEEQLDQMLVENPKRIFARQGAY
jgi:phosphotriesterase-related protein